MNIKEYEEEVKKEIEGLKLKTANSENEYAWLCMEYFELKAKLETIQKCKEMFKETLENFNGEDYTDFEIWLEMQKELLSQLNSPQESFLGGYLETKEKKKNESINIKF